MYGWAWHIRRGGSIPVGKMSVKGGLDLDWVIFGNYLGGVADAGGGVLCQTAHLYSIEIHWPKK